MILAENDSKREHKNRQELDLVVVIMAGGVGKRFWPLSTHERPKQFLNLFGDRVSRIKNRCDP